MNKNTLPQGINMGILLFDEELMGEVLRQRGLMGEVLRPTVNKASITCPYCGKQHETSEELKEVIKL